MIALAAAVAIPVVAQPETALAHVRATPQSSCTSRPTMLADIRNLVLQRRSLLGRSGVARITRAEIKAGAVFGEK